MLHRRRGAHHSIDAEHDPFFILDRASDDLGQRPVLGGDFRRPREPDLGEPAPADSDRKRLERHHGEREDVVADAS
jgi:hypothetical protein